MKFKHSLGMKAKLHKTTIKEGIERDKGKFDGIKPGEEIVISRDEIFGKTADGKCFVKYITAWEQFNQI